MSRYLNITLLFLFLVSGGMKAETVYDSINPKPEVRLNKQLQMPVPDSVSKVQDTLAVMPVVKPDPVRVVWMGAVIPGYGQILNRKYWKLPLVYGGFLGCAYAISWNGSRFNTYKKAYRDITDKDPDTNSFLEILPPGFTIDSPGIGGMSTYTNTLKSKQDNFRRYRDLSIIVSVAYYALTLVDAYVDAQLYDFDISTDLSLRFQPTLLENFQGGRKTFGMQCCINLK